MRQFLIFKLSFFLSIIVFSVSVLHFKSDAQGSSSVVMVDAFMAEVSPAPFADTAVIIDEISPLKKISLKPGKPVRLTIPKIHVDADIEHIGLTAQGAVGAPEGAKEVSWFDRGPRPGQPGSALISGHYGIWKNGTNSVFNLLPTLKASDIIYVEDENGITRSFKVTQTRIYRKDDSVPELFETSGDVRLNLISCYGKYLPAEQTYSQRFVVFAQVQ